MLIVEYHTDGPFLRHALGNSPETVVSSEDQYVTEESSQYIVWAEIGDLTSFERGLDIDSTVTEWKTITETAARRWYRITASEQAHDTSITPLLGDLGIILLDGKGTHEGWQFRVRAPDREALVQYRDAHQTRGRSFHLQTIYHESKPQGEAERLLTEAQQEALVAAYEAGHFDVPQRASQAEVADLLDITPQSFSERLRRGVGTLIDTTLRASTSIS